MAKLLLALFLLLPLTARAQFSMMVQGLGTASQSYVGPVNAGVTTPVACYSIMACSAAAATGTYQLYNVQRASDSHTCDILAAFSGQPGNTSNCSNGGDIGQSLALFLSGTTGTVLVWYDQMHNGNDQSGSAGITVSCNNSLPCVTFNGSQYLANGSFSSTAAQPVTMTAVLDRTAVSTGYVLSTYPMGIGGANTANQMLMYAGGGGQVATMSDNAWHSFIAVFNDVSSTYYIDSNSGGSPTTTAGSPGTQGLTADSQIGAFHFGQNWTGSVQEILVYASGLSATNQGHLCGNEHTRLATPGTCS